MEPHICCWGGSLSGWGHSASLGLWRPPPREPRAAVAAFQL